MHTAEIEIDNEVCYISVTKFGDTNFVTISDTGTFGSFYQVEKKEKMGNEPIFQIQPIFGQAEDYLQVCVTKGFKINKVGCVLQMVIWSEFSVLQHPTIDFLMLKNRNIDLLKLRVVRTRFRRRETDSAYDSEQK